jgi:hypothetical protein
VTDVKICFILVSPQTPKRIGKLEQFPEEPGVRPEEPPRYTPAEMSGCGRLLLGEVWAVLATLWQRDDKYVSQMQDERMGGIIETIDLTQALY